MTTRFLQIHFLTSYPAALLNRDDAGFAKRIPFGGTTRTRISSQCLKRHWRTFDGEHSLQEIGRPMSVRSRQTFEKFVVQPLVAEGVSEARARAVTESLMAQVLGLSAKAKKAKATKEEEGKDGDQTGGLQTGQITVLGRAELEMLLGIARDVAATNPEKVDKAMKQHLGKEGKKNLDALRKAAIGLDASLFGRMVTSDKLSRGDAAVHVAHAFTVHAEAAESDYFSAVDDLLKDSDEENLGSGHIGSTELTSGLFYGYVVVDLPLLISNLEGVDRKAWKDANRELAAQVVTSLVHTVAKVSPGAKLGSTAPYAYAHLVMAESGASQPRTLANAFLEPVRERPNLIASTYEALEAHVSDLDQMYGNGSGDQRRLAAIGPVDSLRERVGAGEGLSLDGLARWAATQVMEA